MGSKVSLFGINKILQALFETNGIVPNIILFDRIVHFYVGHP
jgi:hypothetical protein